MESDGHGWESWDKLPLERDHLYELLEPGVNDIGIKTVILSGNKEMTRQLV